MPTMFLVKLDLLETSAEHAKESAVNLDLADIGALLFVFTPLALLLVRIFVIPDGASLENLVVPRMPFEWPHGIQEEEPVPAEEPVSKAETAAGKARAKGAAKGRGRGKAAAKAKADGVDEAARLVALDMALAGTPREETEQYLAEHYSLDDPGSVLDDVYALAGS